MGNIHIHCGWCGRRIKRRIQEGIGRRIALGFLPLGGGWFCFGRRFFCFAFAGFHFRWWFFLGFALLPWWIFDIPGLGIIAWYIRNINRERVVKWMIAVRGWWLLAFRLAIPPYRFRWRWNSFCFGGRWWKIICSRRRSCSVSPSWFDLYTWFVCNLRGVAKGRRAVLLRRMLWP